MKISSKNSWYSYKGNFEIVENPEGLSKRRLCIRQNPFHKSMFS
jgi:hypothetical protein